MLILDDCLSSVDAQTEAEILQGLRAILKEKTCLIISHRISAVKEADEILRPRRGKNHRARALMRSWSIAAAFTPTCISSNS